jgi:hypothetical protein
MKRFNAVFPFVMAFLCGYHVSDLAWAIDTRAGVHSATDLYLWIIVPVSGIAALIGAWQAFRAAGPGRAPRSRDGVETL